MVFHRSLSDSNSLQVSRTLFIILADLNNNILWMVFASPISITYQAFGDCSKRTNYNWDYFMSHRFFCSLFSFFFKFLFCGLPGRQCPLFGRFLKDFWFLTILNRVFTQDLGWGQILIICILCAFVFCYFLRVIFFSGIDSTLLGRWVVSQNAIFL